MLKTPVRVPLVRYQSRSFAQVPSFHVSRKLSDIVKLPFLERESAHKVREIWLSKNESTTTSKIVHGVIAAPEYLSSKSKARQAPTFLVPVRKDNIANRGENSGLILPPGVAVEQKLEDLAHTKDVGYYNMVSEWTNNEIIFTFLDDFQKDDKNAVPYMVVNIFEEMLMSHRIALLRADILSPLVSRRQGEAAIKYLRECYLHDAKYEWVKKFNHRPREFDYKEFTNWMKARG